MIPLLHRDDPDTGLLWKRYILATGLSVYDSQPCIQAVEGSAENILSTAVGYVKDSAVDENV